MATRLNFIHASVILTDSNGGRLTIPNIMLNFVELDEKHDSVDVSPNPDIRRYVPRNPELMLSFEGKIIGNLNEIAYIENRPEQNPTGQAK